MPIKLTKDGMSAKPTVKTYSPRFFDTSKLELTGSGGKAGLLCELRDPKHVPASVQHRPGDPDVRKKCERVRGTEYNYVPLYILSSRARELVAEVPFDPSASKLIATSPTGDKRIYMRASAHALICDKDMSPAPKGTKRPVNLALIARLDIIMSPDGYTGDIADNVIVANRSAKGVNQAMMDSIRSTGRAAQLSLYTKNVAATIRACAASFESVGWMVDHPAIDAYIDALSVYDMVCERSHAWQEDVEREVMPLVESIRKEHVTPQHPDRKLDVGDLTTAQSTLLAHTVAHLESYPISLNQYSALYASMSAAMEPALLKSLCRDNLNIMLSDLMDDLKRDEPNLARVTPVPGVTVDPKEFNRDQADAIVCAEPLALVASAAGTGKTKTIMGRMDYMIDTGIEPDDIMVITFTNVAADEVRERNRAIMEKRFGKGTDKLVKAMTIDSLVFSIYHENYPDQVLTSSLTLGNALEVYFPNDPDAAFMRRTLSQIADNEAGALTRMNRFVEDNTDRVCKMLSTVKLVTLELANILCYHLLPKLTEPAEVASAHIIMDEVQDTSILQFIFVLRYVQHHKESLFMVGK